MEAIIYLFKRSIIVGASRWLSQLSIDVGSGHDLMVHEFKPRIRLCADSSVLEPALDSVSPSLSATLSLMFSLSLKNKLSF